MTPAQRDHLRCRLYLYAILPALEDLVRVSPEARKILGDAAFALAFRTRSGLRGVWTFRDAACGFSASAATPADIELLFATDGQAVGTFEKSAIVPPMPVKGITKMSKVKLFQKISDLLESYLDPTDEQLHDEDFADAFTQMYFSLALRGVVQLGEAEPHAREQLQHGPHGLAEFRLADSLTAHIELAPAGIQVYREAPARDPDVRIHFTERDVAVRGLRSELDAQAEIGRGRIHMDGLVPLADTINALMERLPMYLQTKSARV